MSGSLIAVVIEPKKVKREDAYFCFRPSASNSGDPLFLG